MIEDSDRELVDLNNNLFVIFPTKQATKPVGLLAEQRRKLGKIQ